MKSAAVVLFAGAAMAAYPVQSSSYETYAVTNSTSAPVYPTYTTSETESECSDEPTSYPVTESYPMTEYPTTTAYPTTTYAVPPVSYPVVVPPPASYPVYNTTTTESECSEESSYPATQPPPPATYPTYTQTTMETYPTGGSTVVVPVPGGNYTTTEVNAPTYPTGGNTVVPPTEVPTNGPSGGNTVVPPTQVPTNGPSGTAPGSTTPPTTSIPTAGAAANSVGLLAVLGAFAAYLL